MYLIKGVVKMSSYQAPLQDMEFLLFDVFKSEHFWQSLPSLNEYLDKETALAILHECGKISEQALAPIAAQGDSEGVSFSQGEVTTPKGYKEAYQLYAQGGWTGLGGDVEYGGMGMPKVITLLHEEMLCAADISFSLYPGLTAGAALTLAKHANDDLKTLYLPKLYQGQWCATMCLTEAHAGSDLGLLRTKAQKQDDGSYFISGSKIFITGGEHDLTENIIHLVLAKLPDAPEGSRGISLFLVPKFTVNNDGSLGEFNQVTCSAIEEKMGIHASATCVLNFDNAQGYLIGEVNKGLACMFTMMNFERLGVGMQGLGAAVRSYQNALTYAKERLQSRSLSGKKSAQEVADPIMVHGDVRRMLLTMKALNEGSRALSVYIAMQLDAATYAEGEAQVKGEKLAALMTPLAKTFFTDLGFESTVIGQQIFGGHGYIRESGQERLVRDARIAQIYEGTNGIQAMDLLVRKVAASNGQLMQIFIEEVRQYCQITTSVNMNEFVSPLTEAIDDLEQLTASILSQSQQNKEQLGSACYDYLHVFGYTAMAFVWAKMAEVALENNSDFSQGKLHTARFYFARLLPRRHSLAIAASSKAELLFELNDNLF